MTGSFSAYEGQSLSPDTGPSTAWIVGKNVPWSVSWTDEQSYDLQVSEDFPGLVDLVQIQRQGMESRDLRRCISRVTGWGWRGTYAMFAASRHHGATGIFFQRSPAASSSCRMNSIRYAGNVPPVHLSCARRAQQLCPHLSHAYAQPMAFPSEESWLIQRTDVVPGMEALAKTLPQNLKIVFTCYRLYGPRFSKRVTQLRQGEAAIPK